MGIIKRLKTVYVATGQVSAVAQFYADGLEMKTLFADGDRWIQFDAQGVGYAVASEAEGVENQVGAVPVFEVESFEGLEDRVRQFGGECVSVRDMGAHGKVMTVRDPGANVIQLFVRSQ